MGGTGASAPLRTQKGLCVNKCCARRGSVLETRDAVNKRCGDEVMLQCTVQHSAEVHLNGAMITMHTLISGLLLAAQPHIFLAELDGLKSPKLFPRQVPQRVDVQLHASANTSVMV